jgi:hypothetical protein
MSLIAGIIILAIITGLLVLMKAVMLAPVAIESEAGFAYVEDEQPEQFRSVKTVAHSTAAMPLAKSA